MGRGGEGRDWKGKEEVVGVMRRGVVGKGRKWKREGRERKEGRDRRGRGKGRAGGAFPQTKIYDYTPAHYAHAPPAKLAVAVHHLPPFLPIPAGHAQWANIELASALIVANLGLGGRDGMVWYGMAMKWCSRFHGPDSDMRSLLLFTEAKLTKLNLIYASKKWDQTTLLDPAQKSGIH